MLNSRVEQKLSEEEMEIYSRQIVLRDIGFEGQSRLKNARIGIIGMGGLGTPVAIQLTALGVGFLRIIDRDVVELSNIHRQHLYTPKDIGYPKVEVAAKRLQALRNNLIVEAIPTSATVDTVDNLVQGLDVVVDGLDSIETRYALNRACIKAGIPYIYGAAIEAFGNVTTIIPHETPCLECFLPNFSDEALPTCAIAGVHPSILSIVGSLQVSEAVRLIVRETPALAGYLLYCDIRNMSFDKILIAKHPDCPVCSGRKDAGTEGLQRKVIQEICGRGGKRTHIVTPKGAVNLPLQVLSELLRRQNFQVKVEGNLGVTFQYSPTISVSILKSGVMVSEGVENEQKALEIYRRAVLDNLQLPSTLIES